MTIMPNFETQFFQKMQFTKQQINGYFNLVSRDLKIAEKSEFLEVKFRFSYDALIEIGIAVMAQQGFKVRSQPGHHAKIIEKLSEIMDDDDIAVIGNKMRQDRNTDFYDGGILITEKESLEYLNFVKSIYDKARTA